MIFVDLLFNGIDSLSDYFSKCKSIDDIIQYARKDIASLVVFSEDDDVSLPFKERFKTALAGKHHMVDVNEPDSYNFYVLVIGCIQQAIDIIASCMEYGCIPYIIYPVSFHYVSLLMQSMSVEKQINLLRFKMSVAFIVYKLCDKDKLAAVCLSEFVKKTQDYNFNSKLFHSLAEHGINEKSFLGHSITQFVIDELEKFYDMLLEAENCDKIIS